ncbi:unnamed protein product [Heligmosomoides polygyrus]|uniref:Uncharacterized protein n=1 Tax=Heligmosomoides polygyrus TaxID=6339 RepID=A0A183F227_HELPZ|nr:unnamed protein product [Heligmosomoides polygyrus]
MTQPDHYISKTRSEEGSIDDELSTTCSLDAANALTPDDDSKRSSLEWTSSSHHRLGGGERNTASRFPASCNVASGNRPSQWKSNTTLYGYRQQGKSGEAASGAPGILEKSTTTTATISHGANHAEPAEHACHWWKPRNTDTHPGYGRESRQQSLSLSKVK